MSNNDLLSPRAQTKHQGRYGCPWPKCFPEAFENSEKPCVTSSFAGFSRLNEHIGKYHSPQSEEEKSSKPKNNAKRQRKEITSESRPDSHMMTQEQQERWRAWKEDIKIKHMQNKEEKYRSLCRCLFKAEDERAFAHISSEYNYLVLGHTVPPPSIPQLWYPNLHGLEAQTIAGPSHGNQTDAFTLDNADAAGRKPDKWGIPRTARTNDSGYVSALANPLSGVQPPEPLISNPSEDDVLFHSFVHDDNSDGTSGTYPHQYAPQIDVNLDADFENATGASG